MKLASLSVLFIDMSIINAHFLFTMARNKKLNQFLDSHELQSSDLHSEPLAQSYSAELFRNTLFQQLSKLNSPTSKPTNTTTQSCNSGQANTPPRYRLAHYYKPKSSHILFTRYSNIRKPWSQVKTSGSCSIQTTTFSLMESHALVEIPDQKRRECAVCRYSFRTGDKKGRCRPKLTRYQCPFCLPPIALCGPDVHSTCFVYWHKIIHEA